MAGLGTYDANGWLRISLKNDNVHLQVETLMPRGGGGATKGIIIIIIIIIIMLVYRAPDSARV